MNINSINPVRENKRPEPVADRSSNEKAKAQGKSVESEGTSVATAKELSEALDNANEIGQLLNRKLNFDVDRTTDRVIVSIVDEESGEVVRQVPPKEMLRIAAHLKKLKDMNEQVMHAVKSVVLDVTA